MQITIHTTLEGRSIRVYDLNYSLTLTKTLNLTWRRLDRASSKELVLLGIHRVLYILFHKEIRKGFKIAVLHDLHTTLSDYVVIHLIFLALKSCYISIASLFKRFNIHNRDLVLCFSFREGLYIDLLGYPYLVNLRILIFNLYN